MPLNYDDMLPAKLYEKACHVKYFHTMLIIIIINPRTNPNPNPEFSGNCKLSFSGGYLKIRGTNLSFHFQWDILRRGDGRKPTLQNSGRYLVPDWPRWPSRYRWCVNLREKYSKPLRFDETSRFESLCRCSEIQVSQSISEGENGKRPALSRKRSDVLNIWQ